MKGIGPICVLLIFLFVWNQIDGQQVQLKRQVISSIGGSVSLDSSFYIGFTTGQSPQSGTIFNNSAFLRQGFEQPPRGPECGVFNNFAIEAFRSECGSYYSFEYTGTVVQGLQFDWDFGRHAIPSSSNELNPMDIVFLQDSMLSTVRLTVTTPDGCENTTAKVLDVEGSGFTSRLIPSSPGCQDTAFNLSVQPINGEEPFTVEWSDGGNGLDRVLSEGTFSYTITDANDCNAEGTIDLTGLSPIIQLEGVVEDANCDTTILGQIDLRVLGGLPPYVFNWSNGSTQERVMDLVPGLYSVTVLDARNCEVSSEFMVGTECLDENDLPNVFTPNGDSVNDTWVIPGIELYPNNELQIYNRWGSLIHEAGPYMNDWGGTNEDGSPLPMGAYYYMLQLNDEEGTSYSGSITIIR